MTIHKDSNNFWYIIINREIQKNHLHNIQKKKMIPIRLKNLYCWMDENSIEVSAESCQTHLILSSFKQNFFCWPTTYLTMALEFFGMFDKTTGDKFFHLYVYNLKRSIEFFFRCNNLSPLLNMKVYSSSSLCSLTLENSMFCRKVQKNFVGKLKHIAYVS